MRARPFLLPSFLLLAGCSGSSTTNSQQNAPGAPANIASVAPTGRPDSALADPAASQIDFAAMAGRWTVTGVAVDDSGVQALAKDDLTYMGQILEIDADRLVWSGEQGSSPASLSDRCDDPVTARQTGAAAQDYVRQSATQLAALKIDAPDPHAVQCDDGQWGPEAAGGAILFPIAGGRIAMSWYDGAVLLLEKQDMSASR